MSELLTTGKDINFRRTPLGVVDNVPLLQVGYDKVRMEELRRIERAFGDRFRANPAVAAYHLIDLYDPLIRNEGVCRWRVTSGDEALVLRYRDKYGFPFGAPELTHQFYNRPPKRNDIARFAIVLPIEQRNMFPAKYWFKITGEEESVRLRLTREWYQEKRKGLELPKERVKRLGPSDLIMIYQLLGRHPQNSFQKFRLANGLYAGVIKGGMLAAMAGIYGVDEVDKMALTGDLYTDERYRRRGFATLARVTILDELFSRRGIEQAITDVRADNEASLRWCERLGYREEARMVTFRCERTMF